MSGQRLRAAAIAVLASLVGGALLVGCGGSTSTSTVYSRTVPVPEACQGYAGGDLESCEDGAQARAAEEGEVLTFEEPEEEELPPEEEVEEAEEPVAAEEEEPGEIVEEGVSGALDQSGTIYVGNPEGYEAVISLERGRVEKASPGTMNGELSEGLACEIDAATDAVEPFHLEVVNETDSFSASPVGDVHVTTPDGEEPPVSIELNYTEGPICGKENGSAEDFGEEGSLFVFHPTEPLQPHEDIAADGFIVLENFYSPNHPDGDRAAFEGILLTAEPGYTEEGFVAERSTGFPIRSEAEQLSDGDSLRDSFPLLH